MRHHTIMELMNACVYICELNVNHEGMKKKTGFDIVIWLVYYYLCAIWVFKKNIYALDTCFSIVFQFIGSKIIHIDCNTFIIDTSFQSVCRAERKAHRNFIKIKFSAPFNWYNVYELNKSIFYWSSQLKMWARFFSSS